MARRTPFPFADHHDPEVYGEAHNEMVTRYIQGYEDALRTEYVSGDVDVASYHEGIRETLENVLFDLLGIDRDLQNAYWGRDKTRPEPATYDLPYTGGSPLITYEQVEEWSGHRLNAAQWESLDSAIPNSSIPEAIDTLVAVISQSEEG